MHNLQASKETSARPVALGKGIEGDLHSASHSKRRPRGYSEGSTNIDEDHGPSDDGGGPSEGTSGGGSRRRGAPARRRCWAVGRRWAHGSGLVSKGY